MCHYKFDGTQSCYMNNGDTIFLSLKGYENITEDEIILFTSNIIRHEHIHRALDTTFGVSTSILYDLISHKFEDSNNLNEEISKRNQIVTWKVFSKTQLGVRYFKPFKKKVKYEH